LYYHNRKEVNSMMEWRETIEKTLDWIEDNLTDEFTLLDLANRAATGGTVLAIEQINQKVFHNSKICDRA
jgi:hypothetical protein